MAIYVNFKKPRTIKQFLIKFYEKDSYGGNSKLAPRTFKDPKCKIEQCNRSSRSFDELLEILQTYYPSTTPKICIFHLLTVKLTNIQGRVMTPYLGVCGGMSRIKYMPYYDPGALTDQYFDRKMTLSKYTWKELLALHNIKNLTQLRKFIKNN